MEQQVDQKPSIKSDQRIQLAFDNLKDILIHSKANRNFHGKITVQPSRFRKILSDYYSLNAIQVEGILDNYATYYDYYTLKDLDKHGNTYRIYKDQDVREVKSRCTDCNCGKRRFINPDTGVCYYREAIENNYTTKI